MYSAEELAAMMAAGVGSIEPQLSQTRFRMSLVQDWKVPVGSRVLEIGCGQGDTTAALANAIGPNGRVLAVDIARQSYGAPITVGDSASHLLAGPMGDRIEFKFEFDALDPLNGFAEDSFDVIVLAHCTWYFESLAVLREMLMRIRLWTKCLCLSEWELDPSRIEQVGHFLSVVIQGQIEAFKPLSEANIRSPYSREALRSILMETGWSIASETLLDTSELSDGQWEIAMCLANSEREASEIGLPPRLRQVVGSLSAILRRMSQRSENRSLESYSIVAERE